MTPLGKITVFYLPSIKLDERGRRKTIHDFLISHFSAYTHTPSMVRGFWTDENSTVVHDILERYEVSLAKDKFDNLVKFLTELCEELEEKSIYLTRGDESFLVENGT